MNKQTRREVIATLLKAGRRDLARQFVGAAAQPPTTEKLGWPDHARPTRDGDAVEFGPVIERFEAVMSGRATSTVVAAALEAYWLDINNGKTIEISRGGGSFTYHMHDVVNDPAKYGLTGAAADKLAELARTGAAPSEIADYPTVVLTPLLSRWIKVYKNFGKLNFTTSDRLNRTMLEAMQDFVMRKRLTDGRVIVMTEPAHKVVADMPAGEFVTAELRDLRQRAVAKAHRDEKAQAFWLKSIGKDWSYYGKAWKKTNTVEW